MEFRTKRIVSMLIDHFTMVIVVIPIAILMFLILLFFVQDIMALYFLDIHGYALLFSSYGIYFLKDNWTGKSLGKRIMGLVVVDKKSGSNASSFQCYVRNIFVVIWPLEVLITLFSPNQRLGDFIAQTRVESAAKESPHSLFLAIKTTPVNWNQVLLIFLATIPYCYLLAYFMVSLNA